MDLTCRELALALTLAEDFISAAASDAIGDAAAHAQGFARIHQGGAAL